MLLARKQTLRRHRRKGALVQTLNQMLMRLKRRILLIRKRRSLLTLVTLTNAVAAPRKENSALSVSVAV